MSMEDKIEEINVDTAFSSNENGVNILDESSRLDFAKNILLCIFILIVTVFLAYSLYPENKALTQIYELIKIGALPLITLVISFYFPSSR